METMMEIKDVLVLPRADVPNANGIMYTSETVDALVKQLNDIHEKGKVVTIESNRRIPSSSIMGKVNGKFRKEGNAHLVDIKILPHHEALFKEVDFHENFVIAFENYAQVDTNEKGERFAKDVRFNRITIIPTADLKKREKNE